MFRLTDEQICKLKNAAELRGCSQTDLVRGFIDSLDEEPSDTQGDTHRDTQEIHGGVQQKETDSRALTALVEPDGDELVSQLGKRRWRVMGDPEDGWWVEVDSDGNELPGDWEYDRKGGYVYCAFA